MHSARKHSGVQRQCRRPGSLRCDESGSFAPLRKPIVALLLLGLSGLLFAGCIREVERREEPVITAQPVEIDKGRVTLGALAPVVGRPVNPPGYEELDEQLQAEIEQAERILMSGQIKQPATYRELDKILRKLQEAASSAPDNLKLQLVLGKIYSVNKQTTEGIDAFRTALVCSDAEDDNPLAAEALLRLGGLLSKEGYYTAALECFTELSERLDSHSRALTQEPFGRELLLRPEQLLTWRGELLLKLDRFSEAAALLEQAFRYDRTHRRAGALYFDALLQAKDFARAESLLEELADEPAQHFQVPSRVVALCRTADDPAMPMRIAKSLGQKDQLDDRLTVTLARCAVSLDAHDDATNILKSFLQTRPDSIEVGRVLTGIYAEQGRYEEALRMLGDMLAQKDEAALAVRQSVREILTGPVPVDIERDFALKVFEEDNESKHALLFIAALVAEARGEDRLAEGLYRRALMEKEAFLPPYQALIDIYFATEQTDRIDRLLAQAAAAAPESYFVPYLKGKVHFAKGQFMQAASELTLARKRYPAHVPTLLLLGRTYVNLRGIRDAAMVLTIAFRSDPDNEEIHRLLFAVLTASEQYKTANKLVRRVLKRNPKSANARVLAAKLGLLQDRVADARKAIDELRNLAEHHEELPVLEVRLQLAERQFPLSDEELNSFTGKLRVLILRYPDKDATWRTLVGVFERQGAEGDTVAADVWGELHAQLPDRQNIAKVYAAALFKLERYDQTTEVLRGVVETNQRDMISQRALVEALVKLGEPDEAAEQALKAQKVLDDWITSISDPRYVEKLRSEKLGLYASAGLYRELADFARSWISAEPQNEILKSLVISFLNTAEKYHLAHELLDEWISEGGAGREAYRQMKAALYINAKQLEGAVEFLLKWIESEPSLILPREIIVQALVDAKQHTRAQQLVDRWVDRSIVGTPSTQATQPTQPTRPATPPAAARWARKTAVQLLLIQHKYATALERLHRYIPLNPQDVDLWVMKVAALNELDRTDSAITAM
ncbi:MAG: tetratricopeptide repeat protein, partial [Planctomycetota bacterium]